MLSQAPTDMTIPAEMTKYLFTTCEREIRQEFTGWIMGASVKEITMETMKNVFDNFREIAEQEDK